MGGHPYDRPLLIANYFPWYDEGTWGRGCTSAGDTPRDGVYNSDDDGVIQRHIGQARAAALCATFTGAVPVFEYATRHIKKAVTGAGAAEKDQIQQMIKMILAIREDLEADAADALAAAICHAHERNARLLVERAAGAR